MMGVQMNRTTKWGVRGAIASTVIIVTLGVAQEFSPYDSAAWHATHRALNVLAAPVVWVWSKGLAMQSIHGDEGMRFIVPILASVLIYVAILGFVVGLLAAKFRRPA